MRLFSLLFAVSVTAITSGCASITLESHQKLAVSAIDPSGKSVTDAICKLTNDKGEFTLDKTPGEAVVRRSSGDMDVICAKSGLPDGTARLISRAGRMWGNLILGGGLGAIVDHSTGKGYNYPFIFEIVMGKFTEYDRHNQENDQAAKSSEVVDGAAPPPRTPRAPSLEKSTTGTDAAKKG
jgi:hypothetical protein